MPPMTAVETAAAQAADDVLIDFGALSVTLWRNKVVIGAVAALFALAAAMILARTPSVYQAQAQILLGASVQQVINIDNIVRDPVFNDGAVVSEIQIIQSTPILRSVAERLNLAAWPEFNPSLEPTLGLGAIMAWLRDLFSGAAPEDEPDPVLVAASFLASKVQVAQFGLSYILQVTASARDPFLAADIANAVSIVYLEQQVMRKREENAGVTNWLAEREKELRDTTERAETRLQSRRAALSAAGRLSPATLDAQIAQLNGELVRAQIDANQAKARASLFDEMVAQGDISAASLIVSSEKLGLLVSRRDVIRAQRQAVSQSVENDAAIRRVEETLKAIESDILNEARELSKGLHALAAIADTKRTDLLTSIAASERAAYDQSSEMVELGALQRDLNANQAVYERFLLRLTEARERGDYQQPDGRIVASAEPPADPTSPRRTLLTALAFVFGAAAAAAGVLLRDAWRDVFRTPGAATRRTGLPVIAAFPEDRRPWTKRWASPQRDTMQAARRMLTLLRADFPASPQTARVVLVVSTMPDEDAEDVCLRLAASFAEQGLRTMLLDVDPFNASALRALAPEAGSARRLEEIGVDLLRRDAPALTATAPGGDAARQITELRARYDVIVISAPPVLVSPDAIELARASDAAILLFSWEGTPVGAVGEALDELRRIDAPVVGLAMSGVNLRVMSLYDYWGSSTVRANANRYA